MELERLVPLWGKLSSRGCSEVPDRSTVEVKGTMLNGAFVRTGTPPQSFMPLARLGFRYEDEEEFAVVEAYNVILSIHAFSS